MWSVIDYLFDVHNDFDRFCCPRSEVIPHHYDIGQWRRGRRGARVHDQLRLCSILGKRPSVWYVCMCMVRVCVLPGKRPVPIQSFDPATGLLGLYLQWNMNRSRGTGGVRTGLFREGKRVLFVLEQV